MELSLILLPSGCGGLKILGQTKEPQGALFYEFSTDDHVPQDHLLRSIVLGSNFIWHRPNFSELNWERHISCLR
jgi:hypothetical protein